MRGSLEIEKKYLPTCGLDATEELMKRLLEFLSGEMCACKVVDLGEIEQEDRYLDTASGALRSRNQTLRIRRMAGRCELTFKSPLGAGGSAGPNRRMERREYTEMLLEKDRWRVDGAEFLMSHLGGVVPIEELRETIVIHNRRRRLSVVANTEEYELSFDRVTYHSNRTGTEQRELQIELEHKNGGEGQLEMEQLTTRLEAEFPQLVPCVESKYVRALRLTETGG